MAERHRPRRAPLRALLVLVVGSSVLLGVPALRSVAAPDTVVRTAPIAASALARRRLDVRSDGALRATTRAHTRAVTACSPIWFDGLAFTWRQRLGRSPRLHVATGERRGALEPAGRLDAEGGPDVGTPEGSAAAASGSDYLWTGGARCVRVRLDLPKGSSIAAIRVAFLNTSGTAAGPGTGPPDAGPSLGGGSSMPVAEAMTREPRIISRERWGAQPRLMNCTPDVAPFLTNAFVHHTAGSNGYSRAQADDIVRGVYAYHTQVRGWCDIGYNFLVDRYGDVFEGRSGGITNDVIGAAQMGFNVGAFSVAVMGTFDSVAPPRAAIRALEHLLAWRLDVAHVSPSSRQSMTSGGGSTTRYKRGTVVRLHAISGHRDTGITDCPGARLYALLPRIRDAATRIGLPKLYGPRLSTTSIVVGQPASVRIVAHGSRTLVWTVRVFDGAGTIVSTIPSQVGDRLDVRWETMPTTAGEYRVLIQASERDGSRALPAGLPLRVTLATTPTPTPTPTATASPTVSPTASPT
jgi:hypothetical protein